MNRPCGDKLPQVYRSLIDFVSRIYCYFTVHILLSLVIIFGVNSNFIPAYKNAL